MQVKKQNNYNYLSIAPNSILDIITDYFYMISVNTKLFRNAMKFVNWMKNEVCLWFYSKFYSHR